MVIELLNGKVRTYQKSNHIVASAHAISGTIKFGRPMKVKIISNYGHAPCRSRSIYDREGIKTLRVKALGYATYFFTGH